MPISLCLHHYRLNIHMVVCHYTICIFICNSSNLYAHLFMFIPLPFGYSYIFVTAATLKVSKKSIISHWLICSILFSNPFLSLLKVQSLWIKFEIWSSSFDMLQKKLPESVVADLGDSEKMNIRL